MVSYEQSFLTTTQIDRFISRHRLPGKFRELISTYYLDLALWIKRMHRAGETQFLGISGAQGTGKSTLAEFLRLALESIANWNVAVLSIDDFYMTSAERRKLATDVHPLLETRGVPGTHDMKLLLSCIEKLKSLRKGSTISLPRFDKSLDDRADTESWPLVSGPIELIILEGWCVGSRPQENDALSSAVNSLEREQDPCGKWRQYVNDKLEQTYFELFSKLDKLVFLQVPNFDAVYRWRLEQEEKLAESTSHKTAHIMTGDQVKRFIQHYERLTTANLRTLPNIADVIFELNDAHDLVHVRHNLKQGVF